jgi:hypothetical protein
MDDLFRAIMAGLRIGIFIGTSGAIFMISVIGMCRWLKWAPINITVNVNNYGEAVGSLSDVGHARQPGDK